MPGGDDDSPARIALGRKLFFDRGISLNQSRSCNDCHRLDGGRPGVDKLPTSPGARGTSSQRNSPTVLNAGLQVAQFWDGRAADLLEQAKEPLLNPLEMAMRSEQDVVNHLQGAPAYRRAFERAFPDQAEPLTFDNVARAIAAFERTLLTPARFDRYLRGQMDALTVAETRGLYLFEDTGCVECHDSLLVGGRHLKKLGIYHPYADQSDLGRFEVTHEEQDKFVFKVVMLRNVTLTAPYFHDGRIFTLAEAVRLMAWMQLDVRLDYPQIDEIVCFLHALEAEHLDDRDGP
jgi:cytochrome c peroxidase